MTYDPSTHDPNRALGSWTPDEDRHTPASLPGHDGWPRTAMTPGHAPFDRSLDREYPASATVAQGGHGIPPGGGWPPYAGVPAPPPPWSSVVTDHRAPRRRRGTAVLVAVAVLAGAAAGAGAVVATHRTSNAVTTAVPPVKVASSAAASSPVSQIVKNVAPAIVEVTATDGTTSQDAGTGMIITSTGEVLTNNHVVAGATTVTVALNGSSTQLPATVVGTDPNKDAALLQITGQSGLPTVTFGNSSQVQVGDSVIAIGNALALGSSSSVTSGIISALNRTITAGDSTSSATETLTGMLQTDAPINPGNSGGALLNSSGQVIGMNTAAAGSTPNGSSAQNIGFAIPSNELVSLIPGLRTGGNGSQNSFGSSTAGGNGSSSAGSSGGSSSSGYGSSGYGSLGGSSSSGYGSSGYGSLGGSSSSGYGSSGGSSSSGYGSLGGSSSSGYSSATGSASPF